MAVKVKPALIGVSILTLWLAFLLAFVAVMNWRARGWSLPMGQTLNSLALTALVIIILVVGFEYSFLYNGAGGPSCALSHCPYIYSFVGSSWIWLGNNMVLVSLAIATRAGEGAISARGLMLAYAKAAIPVTPVTESVRLLLDRFTPAQQQENSTRLASPRVRAGLLYAASLAVLIAYMILNDKLADNAPDSGKYVLLLPSLLPPHSTALWFLPGS